MGSTVQDGVQQGVCEQHNNELMKTMRQDAHEVELLRLTMVDVEHGRMSAPVPGITSLDLCMWLLKFPCMCLY